MNEEFDVNDVSEPISSDQPINERLDFNRPPMGAQWLWFAVGAGCGALMTYLLDPDRGSYRRGIVRDKGLSYGKRAIKATGRKVKDLGNRSYGLYSRMGRHSPMSSSQSEDVGVESSRTDYIQ